MVRLCKMFILILSCLILAAPLCTTDATAECRNEKFGRKICTLDSNPNITRVVNGKVFVGVADALHVYQPNLTLSQVVDLSSDNAARENCNSDLGNNLAVCRNFIQTIAVDPMDNDKVLVCGTNAFFPLCNVHQASNISNYYNLSSPAKADEGYSPSNPDRTIISILASNGRFFSATRGLNFATLLRMSMNPLGGDAAISVTSVSNDNWHDSPEFISVHEHGDYVYFFMRETAVEVSTFQDETRYSRAIRICKTDNGLDENGVRRFRTFQKARITCSVEDFFYDNIKSTFLYEIGDDSAALYATFNAHKNGPAGGAICKFEFDENVDNGIIEVFQHNSYLVQSNGAYAPMTGTGNFACPGTSRPANENNYFLKAEKIDQRPLYISNSEFLDKIATETIQYGNDSQEIVYFTNLQGDIKQVVLSKETNNPYEHTLYESIDDEQVKDLLLEQGSNNERSIIAGIQNAIALIPRGQCSNYKSCFDCFDSRDAYCGWDTELGTCRNKLTDSTLSTLIQSFSASEAVIVAQCGRRPPTSSTTDENPNVPCLSKATTAPGSNIEVTTEKDEEDVDCSTNVAATPVKTEGLTSGGGGSVSIGAIVGAAVGAFVVGVPIGGLVCVLFYSKIVNRNKNFKDEKGPSPETPTELTVVPTGPKVNNESIIKQDNSSKESSQSIEKTDLSTPTLKPAPPPRYILQKPNGVGQSNGGIPNSTTAPTPSTVPVITTPPPPTVPSEYETPTQSTGKKIPSSSTLPTFNPSSSRALTFSRQQTLPQTLPEVSEDDNAFVDNDVVAPLRDFHHHPGTMHNSLPRMKNKNRANGVARKQVPGYKTPRGRTESTTWLRQRSESLSSDISSNTSPLQSPISDV